VAHLALAAIQVHHWSRILPRPVDDVCQAMPLGCLEFARSGQREAIDLPDGCVAAEQVAWNLG
jgi:hypothetical protein